MMTIFQSKRFVRILALIFAVFFSSATIVFGSAQEAGSVCSDSCDVIVADNSEVGIEFVTEQEARNGPTYQPIANGGNSLAEVAAIMQQFGYEMAAGFDINGNRVFAGTSCLTTRVCLAGSLHDDFQASYGTLFVHNHPTESSFSGQDLAAAARWNMPRTMVVTKTYIYVVEPTTDGWGDADEMKSYYSQRLTAYANEASVYIRGMRYSRQKILATPDTPDDGSLAWFCAQSLKNSLRAGKSGPISIETGAWCTHRAMIDVAARYKLAYLRYNANTFDYNDSSLFYVEAVARRQMQDTNTY